MDLAGPGFGEAEEFTDVLQPEALVIEHVENLLLHGGQLMAAVPDLLVQFPPQELFSRTLLIEIQPVCYSILPRPKHLHYRA